MIPIKRITPRLDQEHVHTFAFRMTDGGDPEKSDTTRIASEVGAKRNVPATIPMQCPAWMSIMAHITNGQ